MYVIATAGHVDHGKSTLVRALTGMEPDRWAEERRRGMTIDLGYAWMTLPTPPRPLGDATPTGTVGPAGAADPAAEKLAFVDVPGHERFVPNMLAGLGPVPAVMFVVAADGGWMPQSAEHLAAVDALGVRHGLLVITRADLADPAPATRQALAEIAQTSLGQVEAIAVSAVTGQGLDDLRAAIARLLARLAEDATFAASDPSTASATAIAVPSATAHAVSSAVRLWIDRSFTIKGAGTVVTGTLPAGTVRNGQELLLTPSLQPVRVRGLQALGEPADQVTGVARVALNLRGVPADLPARGMALIEPGQWTLATELDVRVALPAADPNPKFPPELLLHIGAARTHARLRLLGTSPRLTGDDTCHDHRAAGGAPADEIYARLRLRDPLPLHVGDRVLLRDPGAAGLAIYGATVLDPAPPPLARRGAGAAAVRDLSAWPDVPAAADLLRRHKLLRVPHLVAAGLTQLPAAVAGDWLADPAHWAALRAKLPAVVADFCARDPLAPGMPTEAARAALKLPSRELVTALTGAGIVQDGGYLRIFTRHADDAGSAPAPAPRSGQSNWPDPSARVSPGTPAPPGVITPARTAVSSPTIPTSTGATTSSDVTAPTGRTTGVAPITSTGAITGAADRLPPNIAAAVRRVLDDLASEPFAAPDTERLRALGLDAKALAAAARAGLLLRVADLVVLAPGAAEQATELLADLDQPFTTSQARQALRTSRRVAIPLLEYLDRARITERLPGDLRRLRDY
ncbi:MAG TPA: SelB C-terminal domain-containing protein [Trebonia sp.]|nr:SelB C-terminal domain-containing protein [Trebonia sp.]